MVTSPDLLTMNKMLTYKTAQVAHEKRLSKLEKGNRKTMIWMSIFFCNGVNLFHGLWTKACLWDFQWFPPQKIRKLNLSPVGKKKNTIFSALYDLINIAASEQMLIPPLGYDIDSHDEFSRKG